MAPVFADDLAVDVGAVGGVEIAQNDIGAAMNKNGVTVGDRGIGQRNFIIGGASDMGVFLLEEIYEGRQVGTRHGQLGLVVLNPHGQGLGRGDGGRGELRPRQARIGAAGAFKEKLFPRQSHRSFMRKDVFIEGEAASGPEKHGINRLLALDGAAERVQDPALLDVDEAIRFAGAERDLAAAPA